jgi:hypothetical protein
VRVQPVAGGAPLAPVQLLGTSPFSPGVSYSPIPRKTPPACPLLASGLFPYGRLCVAAVRGAQFSGRARCRERPTGDLR